jgi:hypothetical protein
MSTFHLYACHALTLAAHVCRDRESAIAYTLQGKLNEAEDHLRKALRHSPADADCLCELAALIRECYMW